MEHQSSSKDDQLGHCSNSSDDEDPELMQEDIDEARASNRFASRIGLATFDAGFSTILLAIML